MKVSQEKKEKTLFFVWKNSTVQFEIKVSLTADTFR